MKKILITMMLMPLMALADTETVDGQPWSPEIKVKGGNSAFYSIGVGKGEQ